MPSLTWAMPPGAPEGTCTTGKTPLHMREAPTIKGRGSDGTDQHASVLPLNKKCILPNLGANLVHPTAWQTSRQQLQLPIAPGKNHTSPRRSSFLRWWCIRPAPAAAAAALQAGSRVWVRLPALRFRAGNSEAVKQCGGLLCLPFSNA